MDGCVDDVLMDVWMDEWMDGWMDALMDGWMDRWIYERTEQKIGKKYSTPKHPHWKTTHPSIHPFHTTNHTPPLKKNPKKPLEFPDLNPKTFLLHLVWTSTFHPMESAVEGQWNGERGWGSRERGRGRERERERCWDWGEREDNAIIVRLMPAGWGTMTMASPRWSLPSSGCWRIHGNRRQGSRCRRCAYISGVTAPCCSRSEKESEKDDASRTRLKKKKMMTMMMMKMMMTMTQKMTKMERRI